jgi:membrane-associated phospholipid phosphatase
MKNFNALEVYTLIMLFIYCLLYLLWYNSIAFAPIGISLNLLFIGIIFLFASATKRFEHNSIVIFLRKFYQMPIAYYIYYNIFDFIKVVNPYDYDYWLAWFDKSIFGFEPTRLLYSISNPYLTEYLQICYFLFFFYPIFIGIELSYRENKDVLLNYASTIIFGFYFSFILYLFLPAVGPRFYLHDFSKLNTELPGVLVTESLRSFINVGGGIKSTLLPAIEQVNRDCFPSGHTMMTLLSIMLAFKYKARIRYFVLIFGSSLIFSTLYLRYHYFVDVVGGVIFAIITLKIEPIIREKLQLWLKK